MKINRLVISVLVASIGIVFLPSCSDDDDSGTTPNNNNMQNNNGNTNNNNDNNNTNDNTNNNNNNPGKTNTEILAKSWIVDEAFVEGLPDNSSKGLILDVRADGTYTLVSTGYIGTWEFESNETIINWDKGTQFNQVFSLQKFSEEEIDATFKSFATGQDSRWIMIPN